MLGFLTLAEGGIAWMLGLLTLPDGGIAWMRGFFAGGLTGVKPSVDGGSWRKLLGSMLDSLARLRDGSGVKKVESADIRLRVAAAEISSGVGDVAG